MTLCAMSLAPKEAYPHRLIARIYRHDGDNKEAIREFDLAIALRPSDPIGYRLRAETFVDLRDFQSAVRDYGEVLRLSPGCDDYVARGWVFISLHDYQRAIADFNEALRLNPGSAMAFTGRGLTYRTWATEQPYSPTDVFTVRGLSATAKEHLRSAVADFSSAIRVCPGP